MNTVTIEADDNHATILQAIKGELRDHRTRNRAISSERGPWENVIAMLKRFHIIAGRRRNRRRGFGPRFFLIFLIPHRRNLQHGARSRMTVMQEVYSVPRVLRSLGAWQGGGGG